MRSVERKGSESESKSIFAQHELSLLAADPPKKTVSKKRAV